MKSSINKSFTFGQKWTCILGSRFARCWMALVSKMEAKYIQIQIKNDSKFYHAFWKACGRSWNLWTREVSGCPGLWMGFIWRCTMRIPNAVVLARANCLALVDRKKNARPSKLNKNILRQHGMSSCGRHAISSRLFSASVILFTSTGPLNELQDLK